MSPLLRGAVIAEYLARGNCVDTEYLRRRFGISKAQAKKDIRQIERGLNVKNTVGNDGRTVLTRNNLT